VAFKLARTERFKRAFKTLSEQEQKRAGKAILLLADDPRHPGLRVKKLKGTIGIWEARVSRSMRLTFEFEADKIVLRTIGPHDDTLKRP